MFSERPGGKEGGTIGEFESVGIVGKGRWKYKKIGIIDTKVFIWWKWSEGSKFEPNNDRKEGKYLEGYIGE